MKVSELAKKAGVTPDTVRFYTKEGLLHPEKDPDNGYSLFNIQDYQRLVFMRKARQIGFSLKSIKDILTHADHKTSPCPMVRELFESRLYEVEQQISELQSLRQHMVDAMEVWSEMPDGTPDGHTICHLIENWQDQPSSTTSLTMKRGNSDA
jgi:DNA-binding transcriptional MerR regulator